MYACLRRIYIDVPRRQPLAKSNKEYTEYNIKRHKQKTSPKKKKKKKSLTPKP